VRVLRNTKWQQVLASQLVPGDIIRVRTGDLMTADAKIIDGEADADQSAITEESMLISKKEGDSDSPPCFLPAYSTYLLYVHLPGFINNR
jgi:P-type E1-E2 ATPase